MTFVVPFDGSDLAETALVRAREFSEALGDTPIVAVTVIPKGNTEYAREHGWLRPDEVFEIDRIVEHLHRRVVDLAPEAGFHQLRVNKYAPAGAIATEVRTFARERDAAMVFIGSENAGHMVTGISSVGGSVAAEDAYDVVIIRNKAPSKVAAIRELSPYQTSKSDFYVS